MTEATQRAINVDKLDEKQLETAIDRISSKITTDIDEVCDKANKLLARYGLCCKMQIVIEELKTSDITEKHDKISP